MFVVIRVDASSRIGAGHVMRCLALADELKKNGAIVRFICREYHGNLISLLRDKSMLVSELHTHQHKENNKEFNFERSLGVTQEEDANQTIDILKNAKPDWVIVDHYELNEVWEKMVSYYTSKIMVIDDLANQLHYCDALLDQTYGRSERDYDLYVPDNTILLLGAKYALLRSEFLQWREYSLKRRASPELKRVLINMGGTDPDNATGQVLRVISKNKLFNDIEIVVVMGATSPWLDKVKCQAEKMHNQIEVKVNVSNLAELMANSDLAIGAAGSSVWERCCLGLPSIIYKLAENQDFISLQLQANDVALFAGEIDNIENSLLQNIDEISNIESLQRFSNKSKSISDGLGVKRVVEALL